MTYKRKIDHRKIAVALLLIVSTLILGTTALAKSTKYDNTIPPEILRQYNSDVLSDKRPKLVTINQSMIWALRDQPDQGGDVYNLDLDTEKISTIQKKILIDWVKEGRNIFLWGAETCYKYKAFFDGLTWGLSDKNESVQLSKHPVNTDCSSLNFLYSKIYVCLKQYPPNSEVIASCRSGIVAGKIPFGHGNIYFVCNDQDHRSIKARTHWESGTDRYRWELNFMQWILGHRVPGAADTQVGTGSETLITKDPLDRVLLKNGDTISGKLNTDKFIVQTSYATLTFEGKQIDSILLEGEGQNIEMIVLRNGDKLSGKIGPDKIIVILAGGQETEIEKDKIKQILFQQ